MIIIGKLKSNPYKRLNNNLSKIYFEINNRLADKLNAYNLALE